MALKQEGAVGSGWIFTSDMRFAVSVQESYGYRAAFTREDNGTREYFHVVVVDGAMQPAYTNRYADVGPVEQREEGLGFSARMHGEIDYAFVLMPEKDAS